MTPLLLVAALVLGVVVLTPLSGRLGVPQPVAVTVFGLLLALLPGTPLPQLPPDLILPVVLPPLLFAATLRTSPREFRENLVPVLALAVGLTVLTTLAVATAAHLVGLPWPIALVLGAIVSPPDPVAATTVARLLRLPGRLVTVLEGEGLFNDATALVLFKVAVMAAVSGHLSLVAAGGELVAAVGVGVVLGLVIGLAGRFAFSLVEDPTTETTISLVLPYAAYLLAERLHGSGVLAVLAVGLYLRTGVGHRALSSRGWLDGRAVWRYADFALTSAAFALVGLVLTDVLRHADVDRFAVGLVLATLATAVATRALWVFPAAALLALGRRRRSEDAAPRWREATVVAWAGMRGVVTVATALSLPASLPYRGDVVVVALSVVLVTLVLQGVTLAPLVRALHVASAEDEHEAVRDLRRRAAEAAKQALDRMRADADDPEGVDVVSARYEALVESARSLRSAAQDERRQEQVAQALRAALDAEREAVLRARSVGDAPAEATDEVLDEIEARSLREA